jgi:squalene synthase HpnC
VVDIVAPSADPSVRLQARDENFPVASRLLPARYREPLLALYDFARLVDDVGDEAPPAERSKLLDRLEADVHRLYAAGAPELPVIKALAPVVAAHGIPREDLLGLIAANKRDQEQTRYATFAELMEYCALSAQPVGHLVLRIFDAATPRRLELSDAVCSALQVIEHCQDVGEDHGRGRIYLPQEDLQRFRCVDRDFTRARTPTRLRGVVALQARRAERLLDEGGPLVGTLHGPARLAVAGYVAGGRSTLAALRHAAYDVLGHRVRPAKTRLLAEWLRVLAQGR